MSKLLVNWGPIYEKIFEKKVSQCRKKLKTFGLVRYCIYAGNLFGSVPWGKGEQFGGSKTLTKSHDYSRLFSLQKRRLKIRPPRC